MKKWFKRFPVASVMLLVLLCVAPVLALRDFSPANELRYLSIADEALADGHWFAFSNHGEPYADKPPLYFWIVMLCRLLFGKHSMLALGLFSLLPSFGIVAAMDRMAFREERPLTRAAAAMMLLTTALFLAMSVYVRMDMLMCLWIVLALYAYWEGKSGWLALMTFLALFTKGPVGLLVPPLSIIAYLVATGHWRSLGKTFNGRFFAILGTLSLVWLGMAYYEGGPEYLLNLTVGQTVGRAVNASVHQEPVWFYLAVIWGVAAPWCVLTVPSMIASFREKSGSRRHSNPTHRTRRERLFAWTVIVTVVLLSLFSSKLALYLLPALPFLVGVFVLVVKRLGWRLWMRVALGAVSILFALIGLAAIIGYCFFDHLPLPAEYGFARTPLLFPGGVLMIAAGIYGLMASKRGWQRPVLVLGVALLLLVPLFSPLLPRVNEVVGYRQLSEDVRAVARPAADIYTLGLYRPENMDVYLHRPVQVLDPEVFLNDPSSLPAGAIVIVSQKKDAAASGRYGGILKASGRRSTESSAGLYRIWR
ncbi:MAG: glycosyltransferase family 39 protein [Bacteroidales bacterium]|nr:glycosyltransferase family 39 protein [Bacteroidales bacterium]